MLKTTFSALLMLSIVGCATAPPEAPYRGSYIRSAMGSFAKIIVIAPTEKEAVEAAEAGFALIESIEASLSDYRESSEVSALRRHAGGPETTVSPVLWDTLSRSLEVARQTDGAFDPTLGPLVALWRRSRDTQSLPTPDALAAARSRVGYLYVTMDATTHRMGLTKPGMSLDFGAIGAGYAADRVVELLRKRGYPSCLCDISGDFAIGDPPPDAPGWRIRVSDGGPTLLLSRCGISTSGDVVQHVDIGGVRYSHIVDPKTGLGTTHRARATVIAADGTTADAYATALCVLPPEEGLRRLPAGCEARVVVDRGQGPEVSTTSGYQKLSADR